MLTKNFDIDTDDGSNIGVHDGIEKNIDVYITSSNTVMLSVANKEPTMQYDFEFNHFDDNEASFNYNIEIK